ncbi:MAG TPA: phosphatidylglycerophosphatase A [Kofleriaceae bacterium]|nr:phosphatidylglycerophosphatase A [Kofleriaceae bacterium]
MDANAVRPRGIRSRAAVVVSTVFGIGYAPIAPGTWGTAAAVPLVLASAGLTQWGYLALCACVTVVAIAAAGEASRAFGQHDCQRIVVDEVAGYFWTMVAVDRTDPVMLLAGFVLFRAADMLKPPPARAIDDRMTGGAGVVLDDVVAGIWAAAALVALDRSGVLGYMRWP